MWVGGATRPTRPTPPPPGPGNRAARQRTEPGVAERDHDQPDPHRYDPLRPPAGYTGRQTAKTTTEPTGPQTAKTTTEPTHPQTAETTTEPTHPQTAEITTEPALTGPAPTASASAEPQLAPTGPVHTDPAAGAEQAPDEVTPEPITTESPTEPDVMVLPEPSPRNRPTVALDPGPLPERGPVVPGLTRQGRGSHHPTEPLPRPTGSPHTDARLERLENSLFWETDLEQLTEPRVPGQPAHASTRRGARRATRRPAPALAALVVLGLVASFFAWVSAEPFWLALGHGDRGYATTTRCTGSGVTQRCTGRFATVDDGFTISRVTLLGVGPAERVPGTVSPARMVSADSPRAYLGDTSPLLQLRWVLGFALVLFCGYVIAGLTGARRLETARHRRGAILLSLAGPLLLLTGFLIAAY